MSDKSAPDQGGGFFARDLLGDPVPGNWCKRGRPPHVKTEENCAKVRLGLALGWTKERIARSMRITKATLAKHYSIELREADEARDQLVMMRNMAVIKGVAAGRDGAIKQLTQLIDKHGLDSDPGAGGKPAARPGGGTTIPAPWGGNASDLGGGDVAGNA